MLFAVLLTFCGVALALKFDKYVVHEESTAFASSTKWQKVGRAPTDQVIDLQIVLSQPQIEYAETRLMAISDPDSPSYGKHWNAEQVAAYFSPKNETLELVRQWLEENGIAKDRSGHRRVADSIHARITVGEAESLLRANVSTYIDVKTKSFVTGFEAYSIPQMLADDVDFILPVNPPQRAAERSSPMRNQAVSSRAAPNNTVPCDQLVTPKCLQNMYGLPLNTPAHPNNSLGIVIFTWGAYRDPDLDLFFKSFDGDLIGQRPIEISISGGIRQTFTNESWFVNEANFDIQYAMLLSHPTKVINYQVGDPWIFGNMNTLLAAFDESYCSAIDPEFDPIFPNKKPAQPPLPAGYNASDCGTVKELPKVLSVSYVWQESDFSVRYMRRQCLEYLKLGLQGTTVIFSSGDYGTGGHPSNSTCGIGGQSSNREKQATFPCSCPWVTCVGGTQFDGDVEVAFDKVINSTFQNQTISLHASSAGGFSRIFKAPQYQQGHGGTMRGFPDLAVNSDAHLFASNGKLGTISGTSTAAPVFAAMVSRINDARMLAGKSSVGFVNPVLYKKAAAMLRDVTDGSNFACDGSVGYSAGEGWDAVTGMGSPKYKEMLDVFMDLP